MSTAEIVSPESLESLDESYGSTEAFGSYEYSQQYMDELRKLLGFQYYFLSRVYARCGELPDQSLNQNLAEVDQLLAEVFSGPMTPEEREGALCSLEIFFEASRSLSEELGEFPRFDDVWDRYEDLVCEEAEIEENEELAS